MQKEAQRRVDEYRKLCEQVEIVETAMNERMDDRTRAVFRCLFIEHRAWSAVRDEHGNGLRPQQIADAREKAIEAIAEELSLIEQIAEEL